MIGLTIGGKHTYDDFGLKMLSFNVSLPEIYEEKIAIPGRNGPLDVSEALTGEPVYKERTLKGVFDLYEPDLGVFNSKFSAINNCIHGKMLTIIHDKDLDYYYVGRVFVENKEKNALYHEIIITANVSPFKLKHNKTSKSVDVDGDAIIVCENLRMSTVPEITTDGKMTLVFNNTTIELGAGTHIVPDIKFVEGSNEVICTGTGNVTFTYQEGAL